MLNIEKTYEDDVLVVALSGRLDAGAAKEFGERLDELVRESCDIVLDMKDLDYVASAGLRVLKALFMQTRSAGTQLLMRNVQENVMDVFDMTGFSAIFAIE